MDTWVVVLKEGFGVYSGNIVGPLQGDLHYSLRVAGYEHINTTNDLSSYKKGEKIVVLTTLINDPKVLKMLD